MGASIRVLRADDFTGGLNLRADPFQLGRSESPDLLNVDIDPRGGFSSRGGMERLNTSAIGSLSAGTFTPKKMVVWHTATPQVLVAANSKVFFTASTAFTDTTITTTAAHGASFAPWSGTTQVMYVATGSGGVVCKWDGATKTALTASATAAWQDSYASPSGTHAPKANHIASHGGRMWVASTDENGTAFPDRIRFSHENFPESWREVDYIDVVDGGSGITALVPLGEALYVFKKSSIHVIFGNDESTFQMQLVTNQLGCWSPSAITANERGLMFFSWPDGVFELTSNGITDLFGALRPLIDEQLFSEANLVNLHVGFANRRLWVSIPQGSSATASYTYVFDQSLGQRGAWTKFQVAGGGGVACVVDFETAAGARFPLACHPTEPYVLKVDQPSLVNDSVTGTPTAFTSFYTTRWNDAGVISQRKMWRRPDVLAHQTGANTTLLCEAFHDWEESATKRSFAVTVNGAGTGMLWEPTGSEPDIYPGWDQALWGASNTGLVLTRGANLGLARSVQLKFTGPGTAAWGISSISYKYQPRKVR